MTDQRFIIEEFDDGDYIGILDMETNKHIAFNSQVVLKLNEMNDKINEQQATITRQAETIEALQNFIKSKEGIE